MAAFPPFLPFPPFPLFLLTPLRAVVDMSLRAKEQCINPICIVHALTNHMHKVACPHYLSYSADNVFLAYYAICFENKPKKHSIQFFILCVQIALLCMFCGFTK